MIDRGQVEDKLRSRFGSALAEYPGFSDGITETLASYTPYRETLRDFSARLEDKLFNALYERLGPHMTVRSDTGAERRILTSELPDAADDIMEVLFASMKPYSVNYDTLHTYFMETGSLAAARILYRNFASMLAYSEMQLISRILSERDPSFFADKSAVTPSGFREEKDL